MKNIVKICSVILLTLPIAMTYGQDRNVLWSHGLGENAATWNQMEAIFDAERRMSLGNQSPGYASFNGVAAATNETVNDIEAVFGQAGSRNPNNIGIGHSMGGNVLRNIDVTEVGADQRFGGIITVGTPNDGAAIVNSIDNGDVDAAITHACGELLAGPTSEIPFIASM